MQSKGLPTNPWYPLSISAVDFFVSFSISEPIALKNTSIFLIIFLLVTGCELSSSLDDENVVAGVNLTEVFAEPTDGEIQAVLGEWASRLAAATNVSVVKTEAISLNGKAATVRIVSHDVGGVTHYGAVVSADNLSPGSTPVLVYSHGGDSGVSVDNEFLLLTSLFADISDRFVYVIPSFRDETLDFQGIEWQSDGPASPWDWDVDDALSLIEVAKEVEPGADGERIAVLGFSRGAGVGMLMSARDARIDGVLDFFGPTDFFGPFVQDVTVEILEGNPRILPGLDFLSEEFVLPYRDGLISLERIRGELVRRSAVIFADRIARLQIHHGLEDSVVPVSQAERMIVAMQQAGRVSPSFDSFLYEGGEHNPFTLEGSFPRAKQFLLEFESGR